ncbi:RNA polymerase sigma-70 factor, ECF subfamily [Tistlia consotensis]|uniref:RNA polymerase sigma-70 factor, ECF subfamily n=1 Tax=Tistlia consotensis USBA 355 TaxID=560819 RepID=A0A1Y6BAN2_9PROT|nr:sigma-70 family RNA polymerase sigma factor [Tistlia consotensis]SME90725.1 RNA polymerase sigma-70 factor, ECF subfamily [Tistlia consotensis USBA 355]SNR26896.1 RNA polymerase sigma-70 factor, ECF subfamily [Tistlia consotensis]
MNDMMLLIEPLIPPLRRYARALLRDRAAADDLVQDCLERAIGRWHQRRQDGDARSWLFAILHNLAINRLRQAQRRGRHIAVEEADESVFARQPTQEQGLRLDGLRAALAELPEEQRAVILLVSVEDLTYAEAARVLGVPIGTVMSRLARGREKLRRALEEEPAARETKLRRVK